MPYLIPVFDEEVIMDEATGLALSVIQLGKILVLEELTYLGNLQFCQAYIL